MKKNFITAILYTIATTVILGLIFGTWFLIRACTHLGLL